MSKQGVLVVVLAAALPLVGACSRNNIEAVNMANEGDKERGTNVDDAISKYEQATQLDPTNYRILWKLATAYQKKEQWDKVALTCSKAEKLAPTHADYFYLHGYAIVQQAEKGPTSWSDAKEPLETAAKLDPNYHFDEIAQRVGKAPVRFKILVQVAGEGDVVDNATKHWPESRELVELGTLELSEVVADSIVQQKQIIFDPIPRVEGIEASADPLLELRAAIYLISGRRRRTAPAAE